MRKNISVLAYSFFFLFFICHSLNLLWGHGSHFHSAEELKEHIEGHLAELESLSAQNPVDQALIRKKLNEILEHARDYQTFAESEEFRRNSDKERRAFENLIWVLIQKAGGQDLAGTIRTLRRLAILLTVF